MSLCCILLIQTASSHLFSLRSIPYPLLHCLGDLQLSLRLPVTTSRVRIFTTAVDIHLMMLACIPPLDRVTRPAGLGARVPYPRVPVSWLWIAPPTGRRRQPLNGVNKLV